MALADGASQHASHTAVPDDPKLLASFVEDLGDVPFFVKGQRVPKWTVDVRTGCKGPAGDAAGKGVGTLVYFLFFALLPWYSRIDKTKPEPKRVAYHAH